MRFDLQDPTSPRSLPVGDQGFRGLRMKTPREQLPPGYYPRAENKRIGAGLETRPGTRTPVFANLYAASSFIGSGIFSNPNGDEIGLLFGRSSVLGIRAGTVPLTIPVATPFGAAVTVEVVQHFDKLVAHQSDPSFPIMVWDGIDLTTGFVEIGPPSVTGSGFLGMPNPPWSVNFLDRAWFPIPGEPDQIGATDEGDIQTWDSIKHKFRINTGSSDEIVAIHPFFDSSLLIGKRRSIDILRAIPQDLGDAFLDIGIASAPPPRVGIVSDEIGIIARKSGIMAGGTYMFLSDAGRYGGIYQVTTDQHGQYIVDPVPVSDEIEPLIQRINWPYADKSVAVVHGRYAKWMVPMDGARFNNATLVFNLATREWESVDLWRAVPRINRQGRLITDDNPMRMDNVFHLEIGGNSQLFAVNHEEAKVHLLYNGLDDQMAVATGTTPRELETFPIQDVMESRGLSIVSLTGETTEQSNYVAIGLATLAPTLTFTLLIDGADGDEIEIGAPSPFVPDRQRYKKAKPSYVLTNVNDDADDVGRDDFSVQIGDGVLLNEDGVRIQRVWPWERKIILDAVGRFVSLRVSNIGGISQVRSILYESKVTRTPRSG